MTRSKQLQKLTPLILWAALITAGAGAQEPQQPQEPESGGKPKPAARGIPSISEPGGTVENTQEPTVSWQPDTSPATGLQVPTLGSPELAHSYWIPGLEFGSTIQSRPLGQQATGGWYATQYVGGDLSLLEVWSRSQLAVNYSGGGHFTTGVQQNNGLQDNGWFQNFSLGQTIVLNRWQIQVFDYFSYIPDSLFGFAGGTNLASPGVGGSMGPTVGALGTSTTPNQSIYSAIGPRYSNTFAPQITYSLSRRSSITIAGSYGLLRFTESNNVDNDTVLGSAGFNYILSRKNSIGILYRFSSFHFAGEPQALGSHTASFVYTRKVAQRLGLSLSGGPQITMFRVPIGTSSRSTGFSAGVTLKYAVQHGGIALSYSHGLSGGGGVLAGSNADTVTFAGNRQLSRVWSGNVNFGYARNGSVGSATGVQEPTFNDWFAGGGVSRPFGRNINFSVAYTARLESGNQATCTGPGCNTDYTQNMITISLQWHTRPLVLR